jgi:hypothetical protein
MVRGFIYFAPEDGFFSVLFWPFLGSVALDEMVHYSNGTALCQISEIWAR